MTRLALNLSEYVNGVAQSHAEVTGRLFPGRPVHVDHQRRACLHLDQRELRGALRRMDSGLAPRTAAAAARRSHPGRGGLGRAQRPEAGPYRPDSGRRPGSCCAPTGRPSASLAG